MPTTTTLTPVRIGDQTVTARPAWKPGGDPVAWATQYQHYVQTLGRSMGVAVPVGGLPTSVIGANDTIHCNPSGEAIMFAGDATTQPAALTIWCSVPGLIVVRPETIKKQLVSADWQKVYHLQTLIVHARGWGEKADKKRYSFNGEALTTCLVGVLYRGEVNAGLLTREQAHTDLGRIYKAQIPWLLGYESVTAC